LSSLTFSSPTAFEVDDIYFHTSSIPEPLSWASMLVGLALTGSAMRRGGVKTSPLGQA
jgi:hypothetical protein